MRCLVLAAGIALVAIPAAAQTAGPSAGPSALAYRLPGRPLDAPVQPARADSLLPPDAWLGRDKAFHAGASALLTLSGQYVLTDKGGLSNGHALPFAAGAALAVGVAKEVMDSRRDAEPYFSLRDLAADALGVAVGALVTRL